MSSSRRLPTLLSIGVAAVVTLAVGACRGQKRAAETSAALSSISIRQGGCFGTCPVYTLQIDRTGAATYVGKQYAPYRGLHTGAVPADTLDHLLSLAQTVLAKADELPREIETGVVDFARSVITLTTQTDTLEFAGTTEFAPPVERLLTALVRVPETVSFSPDPSTPPPPPSRLRVTLRAADQIQVVQEEYYRQRFKVVEFEGGDPPTFLVSFDPYTMSGEEMVESLRQRGEVTAVEVVE